MRIQVFSAQDLPLAILAVKQEMGPDALILRQKNIWGRNNLGLKGLESVEVTAACLDEGESVSALKSLGLFDSANLDKVLANKGAAPLASMPSPALAPAARSVAVAEEPSDGGSRFSIRKWGRAAYLREQMVASVPSSEPRPMASSSTNSSVYSYDFPSEGPASGPSFDPSASNGVGAQVPESLRPAGKMAEEQSDLPEPRSASVALRTEINTLRSELESMRRSFMGEQPAVPYAAPSAVETLLPGRGTSRPRATRLSQAMDMLSILGLEPEYAKDLINDWFTPEDAASPGARAEVQGPLRAGVKALCRFDADISNAKGEGPRVVALVGGTGVGKTTTLAKIAAREALNAGRRVALLTCDNFRIAAVEQLRMYARIIGVPMKVINSSEDMKNAIRIYGDYDLILVDTPGLSPRLDAQFVQLTQVLNSSDRIEKFLTLSATTKTEEMIDLWKTYSEMGLDRLVFCKLDESIRYGCLLPVLQKSKIPVAFLTDGQRVPEDLRPATGENIYGLFENI